jgi:hypothetical protein
MDRRLIEVDRDAVDFDVGEVAEAPDEVEFARISSPPLKFQCRALISCRRRLCFIERRVRRDGGASVSIQKTFRGEARERARSGWPHPADLGGWAEPPF